MSMVEEVLKGNRLALSRLLTQVENATPSGRQVLSDLFPYSGKAHLIGVTGAPGCGKSSLVNALAKAYRISEKNENRPRVAIIAVDPSSPFTGGAILGDRIRMRDLAGDEGVFIRSVATRGALGGLASTTAEMALAMDAAGFTVVIIETVGAGQAEIEIARLAHTTLVIDVPGLGDEIQAIKAGILEIADILVINKADLPGVGATERALRANLLLGHPTFHSFQNEFHCEPGHSTTPAGMLSAWIPPVMQTVATQGIGIQELLTVIHDHRVYLDQNNLWLEKERIRLQSELISLLKETLLHKWRVEYQQARYDQVFEDVMDRKVSPWQAVDLLTK